MDLYLLTFQSEKALHLLAVLEKLTVQGNNKNGKGEVGFPKDDRPARLSSLHRAIFMQNNHPATVLMTPSLISILCFPYCAVLTSSHVVHLL